MTVRYNRNQRRWWADDGRWTVWENRRPIEGGMGGYTAVDYVNNDVWRGLLTLGEALVTVAPADDVQAALALTFPKETESDG
jgi:hypothetical protein